MDEMLVKHRGEGPINPKSKIKFEDDKDKKEGRFKKGN